jgi:hypothetical protein
MVQGIRLLQPPKSCWFPLCLVCFDGKIKTKIKKALTCINQHRDFSTPYANQFYVQTWHSFIPVSSYEHHQVPNAHKTSSIKQHTIKDYWTKQRSMNPCLYQ